MIPTFILPLFFMVKARGVNSVLVTRVPSTMTHVSFFTVTLQTDREVWYFLFTVFTETYHIFNHLLSVYFQLHASLMSLEPSTSSYHQEVFQYTLAFIPTQRSFSHPPPKTFPLMSNQHLQENKAMILFQIYLKLQSMTVYYEFQK